MKKSTEHRYQTGVDRVIDYITTHYHERMDLRALAQKAFFSPWHFHRIFKAVTTETPQEFITRIRLEQSVLLMDSESPLTDLAQAVGFSSSSHFSYAFRKHFHISPRRYRAARRAKKSKIMIFSPHHPRHNSVQDDRLPEYRNMTFPAYTIVYVRHIGNYDFHIGAAWRTLMNWARKKKLVTKSSFRISFAYDAPWLTPDGKLRYDACLVVPDGTLPEGRIGVRTVPCGPHAVFTFHGRIGELSSFYEKTYRRLVLSCRKRPGDGPAYIVHRESKQEQIRGRLDTEIRIPLAD